MYANTPNPVVCVPCRKQGRGNHIVPAPHQCVWVYTERRYYRRAPLYGNLPPVEDWGANSLAKSEESNRRTEWFWGNFEWSQRFA